MFIMGGWQAFIEDFRGRDGRHWIDRDQPWLMPHLLELFPLVLNFEHGELRHSDTWERWKIVFAKQYKRRTQDRRPVGIAYVWWNGLDSPRRSPP